MSIRAVVEFWRKVQESPDLQAKLTDAGNDPSAGQARVARDAGYEVTPQEMHDVERVVAFWQRVERDDALRQKLAPAHQADTPEQAVGEIRKVAKGAGYELQLEALQVVTGALVHPAARPGGALSDEQLDAVAGGAAPPPRGCASLEQAKRKVWQDPPKIGPGVIGSKP